MNKLPNKSDILHARTRPEFKKRLLELATAERRSMSAMLEELLEFYVAHHPSQSPTRPQHTRHKDQK